MKVILKTKSNFKNCNYKPLDVIEISGTRITVLIPRHGFNLKDEAVGEFTTNADFHVNEIQSFSLNAYKRN